MKHVLKTAALGVMALFAANMTAAQDLRISKDIKPNKKLFGKKPTVTQEFVNNVHIIKFMSRDASKHVQFDVVDNGDGVATRSDIKGAIFWKSTGDITKGQVITTTYDTGHDGEAPSYIRLVQSEKNPKDNSKTSYPSDQTSMTEIVDSQVYGDRKPKP